MKCPECDREMLQEEFVSSTRGGGGKLYDWTKFSCSYDDIWIEQWVPHKEEETT